MALTIPGYIYIVHKLIQRLDGSECQYTVAGPDGKQINEAIPVSSVGISEAELTQLIISRLSRLEAIEASEALRCRHFDDMGPVIREALTWVIVQIRKYPNVNYAQAETAWNAQWADSLFTWSKLATWVQKIVGEVTWNGFKTYVINHRFEGIE